MKSAPATAFAPRFPLRLVLFGVAGATAFAFGFLAHTPAEAGRLVQRFGYAVMFLTVAWWVTALVRTFRPAGAVRWRPFAEGRRGAAALIAGLTLVAWTTLPHSYKILYDELVLQATAWNVHFGREFGTLIRGYEVEGVFRSLEVYVDKRPFFYPFLVSLVHDLTGFREANAYLVNALLLPAGLVCLYLILRRMAGRGPALAGLACFGASSLLVQNANGTGMEMLNLAMFLLTLWLAIRYLEKPDEPRLSALVLSAVLLAQTRYESALFVGPSALVILEGWRRAGRVLLPPAAVAAPLLLIPCALHNTYLAGTPLLWELRETDTSRFSPAYVWPNLTHALLYLFDFSRQQLSSWWLAVTGLPALGAASWLLVRRARHWRTAPAEALAPVLFGAGVIANLGVLMCYYWGQLDDPIVSRLILPFNAVLALAIAWVVERLPRWRERAARWLVTGALVTYLSFGLTASAYNLARNELATEIAWEQAWVDAQPPRDRLIITNKSPLGWLIRGIPCLTVFRARGAAERLEFHLRHRTFQEVLVCQYYRPIGPDGGFQLDPRDELPASYVLEPVIERRVGARLLRISRVAEVRPPTAPAPGGPSSKPAPTVARATDKAAAAPSAALTPPAFEQDAARSPRPAAL